MKLIKRVLPFLILWFVAGGRAACHSADIEQPHARASRCPTEKEEANEATIRFRMPEDHRGGLEMIQGSQWTRHRVTYITLLVDKEVRGWTDIRYKAVKLRVWKKPSVGSSGSTEKERRGKVWGISKQSHKVYNRVENQQTWGDTPVGIHRHRALADLGSCRPGNALQPGSRGQPMPTRCQNLGSGHDDHLRQCGQLLHPDVPGGSSLSVPSVPHTPSLIFNAPANLDWSLLLPKSYVFLTGWIEHLFTHLQMYKSFTCVI